MSKVEWEIAVGLDYYTLALLPSCHLRFAGRVGRGNQGISYILQGTPPC